MAGSEGFLAAGLEGHTAGWGGLVSGMMCTAQRKRAKQNDGLYGADNLKFDC